MTEFKIISKEAESKKIEKLSIEELNTYKIELHNLLGIIDIEIKSRIKKKDIAENFFKK
tara:strand:- start:92 stop:268 length:177 start_codon:yes stop_codon:yes gene_type:complete